jgi:hypothetical protein
MNDVTHRWSARIISRCGHGRPRPVTSLQMVRSSYHSLHAVDAERVTGEEHVVVRARSVVLRAACPGGAWASSPGWQLAVAAAAAAAVAAAARRASVCDAARAGVPGVDAGSLPSARGRQRRHCCIQGRGRGVPRRFAWPPAYTDALIRCVLGFQLKKCLLGAFGGDDSRPSFPVAPPGTDRRVKSE